MASLVQMILIITWACLVDCRVREEFHKHISPPIKHQRTQENDITNKNNVLDKQSTGEVKDANLVVQDMKTARDADAIVFPSDIDSKIYPNVNKIANKDINVMDINKHRDANTTTIHNNGVAVPLISKVVPAIEPKEVFTNPIVEGTEDATFKVTEDKENIPSILKPIQKPADVTASIKNITHSNINVTLDYIKEVEIKNDTSNSSETAPDFSNRFGATGNYMLVPVNNVQNYEPMQVSQNGVPVQGAVTYVANDQGNASPLVANVGSNSPNLASNTGTQYIPSNVPNGVTLYAAVNTPTGSNVNYDVHQGTNLVPINVPNTYNINGQLYAAVTVPNNVNVPNSLYFVNPQAQPQVGYQVANNLPLYKLVSVGGQVGGQVTGQIGGQVGQASVNAYGMLQ